MNRKPILLVGGASVSSILIIFLGMLLMLAILILLTILGWRVGL